MGTLITILVVAASLALAIWRNAVSTRRQTVVLALPPAEATVEVESAFPRVTWVRTDGPGNINRGRVAKGSRMLVVSVDIIDCGNGASEIRAWVSDRKDIAGFTIANGALKASQLAAALSRHPACVVDRNGDRKRR